MDTVDLTAAGASTQLDGTAAALDRDAVLARLGSDEHGLAGEESRRRFDVVGPNVLRSHGTRFWGVLARQFRSFLLVRLLSAGQAFTSRAARTAARRRMEHPKAPPTQEPGAALERT